MKDFTVIFNGEITKVRAKYFIVQHDCVTFYDEGSNIVATASISALIF